ncbi:potassium channel family protein [uncultured Amnibacterium sp.]|uniref:potassium channel family protein n=1 Tax=uncultured Amnibacterium sp. TaxID=1631851 RepID=UPI0035CBE340
MASKDDVTLERWRHITEWPLTALAVIFLIAYAVTVIENLPARETLPDDIMNAIWACFVIDYVVSLVLARPRRRWFLTHVHELIIVALPVLRPLRLLRLISVVRVLHRGSVLAFRGRVAVYVVITTVLLVLVAGLAVLDAEQNAPGSNIRSFGDAVWWAFTTVTTVGYGDYYPVTLMGRLVAVGLMAAGVALLGTVTALLASWFVEQVRSASELANSATGDDGMNEPSRSDSNQ